MDQITEFGNLLNGLHACNIKICQNEVYVTVYVHIVEKTHITSITIYDCRNDNKDCNIHFHPKSTYKSYCELKDLGMLEKVKDELRMTLLSQI